jgi:hypothetical protein
MIFSSKMAPSPEQKQGTAGSHTTDPKQKRGYLGVYLDVYQGFDLANEKIAPVDI